MDRDAVAAERPGEGLTRRSVLCGLGGAAVALALGPGALQPMQGGAMYGLIGKIRTVPGERDALIAILLDGVSGMPGCASYVVARDPADPDAIWVTEVWESEASHRASLSLPQVRDAIARGKPLIAGFDQHVVTEPVGGHGLASTAG